MAGEKRDSAELRNNGVTLLKDIPVLEFEKFSRFVTENAAAGLRVSAMFGIPKPQNGRTEIFAILADDRNRTLLAARTKTMQSAFPSLTPRCPQVHLFEREIAEQCGVVPEGHPWLKPVRYHRSAAGRDAWGRSRDGDILPAVGDFFRVDGEEVHEVAVGPVHAGVIEPGHFRFQCHGEHVFHLEIALGYQHRGVEDALLGGPDKRTLHYAETLAGDTTIGHATSACQIMEALSGGRISPRAEALRGVALELERLANHAGDLGALSGDVGFLPTASFCGRIRGDFLNMSALLCGNRFGRGMILPGGVGFDVDPERADELLKRLKTAEEETAGAVNLLWTNQSVMARFEDTGPLPPAAAEELGIVGPAARASGLERDIRTDHPSGIYNAVSVPVSKSVRCDVSARAYVRWLEITRSVEFIRRVVNDLPAGPACTPAGKLAPDSLSVAMNEGWRGEICHVAITDGRGKFSRYKVVDPSFHNWSALAYALRGGEISDFPLCNKSFNLSYCGHDL